MQRKLVPCRDGKIIENSTTFKIEGVLTLLDKFLEVNVLLAGHW